jgi:hypothetical protein
MVMKGPIFQSPNSRAMGISTSLLEINSAVTALVMKSPARKIKSHSFLRVKVVVMGSVMFILQS